MRQHPNEDPYEASRRRKLEARRAKRRDSTVASTGADGEDAAPRSRLKTFLVALGLLTFVAGGLAALTWVPGARASGLSRATRSPGGAWSQDAPEPPLVSFRFAETDERVQSSSAWSQRDEPLTCARAWIHQRSETPLAYALGRALQDALLADALLIEVVLLPAGAGSDEERSADLHLVLDVRDLDEKAYPGVVELQFEAHVMVDHRPPLDGPPGLVRPGPILQDVTLDYSESTRGLVTPDRRYDVAAEALVEVLDLRTRLDAWRGGQPAGK